MFVGVRLVQAVPEVVCVSANDWPVGATPLSTVTPGAVAVQVSVNVMLLRVAPELFVNWIHCQYTVPTVVSVMTVPPGGAPLRKDFWIVITPADSVSDPPVRDVGVWLLVTAVTVLR